MIGRVDVDGSNVEVVKEINLPGSRILYDLSLDIANQEIYWIYMDDRVVHVIDYEGNNLREITWESPQIVEQLAVMNTEDPTPVEENSWGRMKTKYLNDDDQ
jgi:hypothetical protein